MTHHIRTAPRPEPTVTIMESVHSLFDQGSETIGVIKTRVGDATDRAKHQGAVAYVRTTELIRANPFKSLVVAFGAGYVAMRIRTSPVVKIALIAGLAQVGRQLLRR